MTNSDSSLDCQNEDYDNNNNNDDDSDSVLSLYAPSDASFLDENDANISNDRFVQIIYVKYLFIFTEMNLVHIGK